MVPDYIWEFAMANVIGISGNTKENRTVITDSGRVRIGNTSPAFPPARSKPAKVSDTGKVRIGNTSPAFPPARSKPAKVSDTGKVRIGNTSPAFPPVHSR
jgi:hypothetical protein